MENRFFSSDHETKHAGYAYYSEFERMLLKSENQLGTSVLLILTWLASSDGIIDDSEEEQLYEILQASKNKHDIEPLISIVQKKDLKAIQLACEIVKGHFINEKADLFLEMAVGVAIADGYLFSSENYILRFIADLLNINFQRLNTIFQNITGKDFPEPVDLSRKKYWQNYEGRHNGNSKSNTKSDASSQGRKDSPHNQKIIYYYAVLGLEVGATKAEIKKAFSRLAQIHHPDRFSSLGDEAVAASTTTFHRIKEAYDYLIDYA